MLKSLNLNRFALALIASYLAVLGLSFGRDDGFLIDPAGKPQLIEFVGVRAAGELVLEGKTAAAYDWATHSRKQSAITGQTKDVYYPWGYPPPFLIIAALLATLPYVASALLWIASTLALQMWSVVAITGTSRAALWLLAAPPAFMNVSLAHTGFLLAGLMGLGLAVLASAPIAAGVAFGLLAFKPQFGLLVPVALVAGRHWRTMVSAALTVALMTAVSFLILGADPWLEFPAQVGRLADSIRFGGIQMSMLISIYGLGRTLGLDHATALIPQAAVTLAAVVVTYRTWRGAGDFNLKAATLIIASLFASPYLFVYDLCVLVAAVAFLYRATGTAGFDETELGTIAVTGAVIFTSVFAPFQAGLIANGLIAWLVWRRWQGFTASSRQPDRAATAAA
jgi:arabinofuranan 3-O-arabinosyltransferase